MAYILAYDIGTTGVKTCLFELDKSIRLLASASGSYPLYVLENGGAEQDGDDWWRAMGVTTRELFADKKIVEQGITPADVAGISFCSQMQGVALVDRDGVPVHRPMSYMDQRSGEEIKKGIAHGIQIAGANVFKVIPSLIITGAISCSVKDPVWKYKWIEAHEPENFARAYKWLDVKEYLLARCTGRFVMTEDSAFGTLIYDTRKGKEGWSRKMCSMFGVNMKHLPEIIRSSDEVGLLTEQAARELGLVSGIPVFGGGGDASLIGVGAGAVGLGRTHIYWGTSGWVITVTDAQKVDASAMIAAIVGARKGYFNYFAEMETAGKAFEWARDRFFPGMSFPELSKKIGETAPGSGGIIFTPWLHGNRCPFEDPNSAGIFFNLKLESTCEQMARAVVEGVCFHLRWMLECQEKKVKASDPIRFVGGGSCSPEICQILADILGRKLETVDSPQNAGSVGAAAVAAVGLGLIPGYEKVEDYIPAAAVYTPDMKKYKKYDKSFAVFKKLYSTNKKLFRG